MALRTESNFSYLFTGLVVLLVVEPIGDAMLGRSNDHLIGMMLGFLLLLGVWGLQPSRRWRLAGRGLVVACVGFGIASAVWQLPLLQAAAAFVGCLFFLLSIGIGLRQILAPGPVTLNHLLGAASVYLMLGLVWALVFWGVNALVPGAFAGVKDGTTGEFIYFSFITLATLGYGDVAPVHPIVRTIAYFEAVVGQLYVAVLVASLVSRHVANRQHERPPV